MLRTLDKTRPFAELLGLPGAAYEQDGVKFKPDGTEALPSDLAPIVDEIIIKEKYEINPPSVSCIEMPSEPVDTYNGRTIEDMHWKQLKALVESYGGAYTDRMSAISFMRGKK